jgi:ABC-type glycerol-3-phosphate transport system permease component
MVVVKRKNLAKNDVLRFTGLEILMMLIIFISFFMPMILVVVGSLLPIEVVLGEVRGFGNIVAFNIDNYVFVIQNTFMIQNILNSVFFVAGSLVFTLGLSFFVATGLVKLKPMIQKIILGTVMASMILPIPFTLGFLRKWIQSLGWMGQSFALLILYTILSLPLCIYIYVRFLEHLPQRIQECSMMDGLNWFQRIKVLFLHVKPASLIVSIFCIVFIGNDFLIADTLHQSTSAYNINQEILRLIQVENFNRVQIWAFFSFLFVMVALISVFLKDMVFPNFDDEFRL